MLTWPVFRSAAQTPFWRLLRPQTTAMMPFSLMFFFQSLCWKFTPPAAPGAGASPVERAGEEELARFAHEKGSVASEDSAAWRGLSLVHDCFHIARGGSEQSEFAVGAR